jgi:hypothetical protein
VSKMSKSILSKSELTAVVLAEIRQHKGCDGIDSIVIQENSHARAQANWEISIVAASSGDPSSVQRAAAAVQKALQIRYQLGRTKMNQFQVGDRVRLSELGRARFPSRRTALGTISVEKRRTDGNSVRVLFDGSKTPARLHESLIEPAYPEQPAMPTSKETSI